MPGRAEIARTFTAGLTDRGWQVREVGVDPLSGRLVVTDPASGEECEVDILKEAFWRPPTVTEYGPVLTLDDVIGTKVRALADRGAVRDLIDIHAASRLPTTADLKTLGRRHARDEFCLEILQARLADAEWYEDEEFIAYGLTATQTATLRAWAGDWADDLAGRLHEETSDD
nr:nucleotidyl transferase AbiEii/AbiGii toxin family protein [Streptomyces sp. PSAA01]